MPPKKTSPARTPAARTINLDRKRAARAETKREPVFIKQGGEAFELPAELPIDFALLAQEERIREAVNALFGEDAERFFATRPSLPDLEELLAGVNEMYGLEPGEESASPGS